MVLARRATKEQIDWKKGADGSSKHGVEKRRKQSMVDHPNMSDVIAFNKCVIG